MNEVRFPLLLRIVGITALLHAGLGLFAGLSMMFVVPRIDPEEFNRRDFTQTFERMPEELRTGGSKFDSSVMPKIISSREFRLFFYLMASFGLAYNAALVFLGYLFLRVRPKAVWPFICLMLLYPAYFHGLPRIFPWSSDLASPFAAAWGVGNMGLGLILFTYFWLWGPVLALVARGKIP
jgi:hypothetical protein